MATNKKPPTPKKPETKWAGTASPDADAETTISTTMPGDLLRHNISDEELQALNDMKTGHLWEVMWFALGSALSFLPNSIIAINDVYWSETPTSMHPWDLTQIILVGVFTAVFVILCIVMKSNSTTAADLCAEIRARSKVKTKATL